MTRLRIALLAVVLLVAAGVLTTTVSTAEPHQRVAPPTQAKGVTLAEAASKPHGVGARDVKAKGKPGQRQPAPQLAALKDKHGNRVSVQGCLLDYGGGDQCLPAVPPAAADMGMDELSMPWTCIDVRALAPKGITVSGKDVLKLDRNKDAVACGPGD